MTLIVDKIKCDEESDEVGADSIYLISFIGRTVAPFSSALGTLGPGSAWNDFETGETVNQDVNTGLFTASDAVYAVMMVERDSSKDISGNEVVGNWRARTDLAWKSIMLGFALGNLPTGTNAAKDAGFAAIRNTLNGLADQHMGFPFGDDDVIDVKRVTITQPGQSQTIMFRSPSNQEDATYHVTFKHN